MKTKSILLSLLAVSAGIGAFAQENDDMYFTSKDRTKISLSNREEVVLASAKNSGALQTITASDSYSGRNENPDYVAGAKVGSNASTSSYFSPNYQPNVNQSLYSYNNSNTAYNNNSYGGYGYSPYSSMYGMGYSPYSMYGMGYYSPYSMYGMGYGYGMGYPMMSYGLGFGYSSFYGMYGYPYMGYGMGYGYSPYSYGYGYTTSQIVAENHGAAYGRRPTRSTSTGTSRYNSSVASSGSSRGNTAYYNGNGRSFTGARTMASNTRSASYYNNGWRNTSASTTTSGRSAWSNSGNSSSRSSSFWNNANTGGSRQSSWGNSSNSNSGWGGARSSGGFSGGGFSGGGGGGHSSGGGGGHGRR